MQIKSTIIVFEVNFNGIIVFLLLLLFLLKNLWEEILDNNLVNNVQST